MMRAKLRHAPLLAASLLVAACADDTASQDTDAGSSSSGTDPTDTLTDPTTTLDPDSSSGSDTDPMTSTATFTTTSTESSSGGGACIIPTTLLGDPGFEGGAGGGTWGEESSAFGTPLCDDGCGGAPAQEGSWYVWLGGAPGGDIGGVSQEVTIGAADDLTLRFYFWYSAVGSGADVFQLQIDGDVLWEVTNADAGDYAAWTEVEVDVSKYADDGDHDIDFTGIASGNASLLLDNVRLESCGTGAPITMTDSVGPAMTGGETDATTDTAGMLTCEDLGNAVPVAQADNNGGSGDDIVGSCLTPRGDDAGEDVGYTWTAPANGTYRFDTLGSPLDTVLIVLDDCEGGAEIACSDDAAGSLQSSLTLTLTQDQTVAIVVDGWGAGDIGDFTLNINQIACEAPDDLGNNLPIEQDDDNTGAGDDVAASCGGIGGEDVVYTWTAPDDAIYAIYTVSLQMAPVVSGYSGTCGDPGSEIGCGVGNGLASFNAVLAADQEITIVVDGADETQAGAYELNIEQVGVLSGDCCAADASAGCEDIAATQCTCGFALPGGLDPVPVVPADCCTGEWTEACASLAATQCNAGCALTPGEGCCVGDSGMPGCDVPAVQDCVCAFDDYCCGTDWDALCVAKAELFCFAECA